MGETAPARAQRSKAALTGKTEEGESDGESTSSLNGERRAAVKGALDMQRQRGHVEAGGVT